MSLEQDVMRFIVSKGYKIPLYSSKVQAGFPSPAEDYKEGTLDLNEHLIRNPASTFCVRTTGDSMINAGIHSGDLLLVDKSIKPKSGDIVVAKVNNEFTLKRLIKKDNKLFLQAENSHFPAIEIDVGSELEIFGVVVSAIKKF